MGHHFRQHYTVEQARALLPQVRQWLDHLLELRKRLEQADKPIEQILKDGHDAGGDPVHRMVRLLADIKDALREFQKRDIQLKDLERGLIDFPAIIGGKEVFLCWEKDEDDIEFWHDLDTGYAGRERL